MRIRLDVLFYTFLVIFAATALVTLLGVIGVIPIDRANLNWLLGAFLIELAGAVITLFRGAPFFVNRSDITASLASSIAVIDDVTDGIEALVLGRMQADINKLHGIVVRKERGALVAYSRLQVIKGDDLQKLPAAQLDTLETYQKSMDRFHQRWKSLWAKRSSAATVSERDKVELEIQELVRGMQKDLHAILDFLANQGMVLQDHYDHVRSLVDDLVAGRTQKGYVAPPASPAQ